MTTRFLGAHYFLRGSGHIIRPASELDQGAMAMLPVGKIIAIEAETADDPKSRQFYFGLIAKLVAGGVWAHRDAADTELMVRAGRVCAVEIGGGITRYTPASKTGWRIPEWREYLGQVVPIVLTDIAPAIPWPATRTEIERYCGITLADARQEEPAHG